jgi:hypothetical protein
MELNVRFRHRLSDPGQRVSKYPDEYAAELTPDRVWRLLRRQKSVAGIGNRSATTRSPSQQYSHGDYVIKG